MAVAALVLLGLISLGRLGVDLLPDVEFPYVSVVTVLEGAGPETIETEVTDVLEEEINTIGGIRSLESVSYEGRSDVLVQFEIDEDLDVKSQEVRDRVARVVRELPPGAEIPVVEKIDPGAAPVLSVVVAGTLGIRDLTQFADDVVKARVERLPGVGSVRLVGGVDREVRVWLDAGKLRAYGATAGDVLAALASEHVEVPGGKLESAGRTDELAVRTESRVRAVAGFAGLRVASRDGLPTKLGDVARVEDGVEDEESYAEVDGVRCVTLEVRRQSGRNAVELAREIRAEIVKLEAEAPAGVRIEVARDVSRFIESAVSDAGFDITLGAVLAMAVTLAFLRSFRAALLTGIAIPTSVVATFFLFDALGFTLNIITLMGLSVAVGILVDDAVVVVEAVQRRVDRGEPPREATIAAVRQVGTAVVSGTVTVLAVFVPIAFMEGLIGRFFFEYGLAVSFSVAISLLVAVTLTPMLSARILRPETAASGVARGLERAQEALERGYLAVLRVALRHRLAIVVAGLGSLQLSSCFLAAIPLEFAARVDRSEFEGVLELRPGIGLDESRAVARRVADAFRADPGVASVITTIAGRAGSSPSDVTLYVQTVPKRRRSESQFAIMARCREALRAAAPEAHEASLNEILWISGGIFSAYAVEYSLLGDDLGLLRRAGERIVARMRDDPLFLDAKLGTARGKPEVRVRIDRDRATDLGVSALGVATTVHALIGGLDAASYEEGGDRYDVRVRLERTQRDELPELGLLQMRSAAGTLVDLASLAAIEVGAGPVQIERKNRSRKVSIYANTADGVTLGTASTRLEELVEEAELPDGYGGRHATATELMNESAQAIGAAFGLAFLVLYLVLASEFESFLHPLVIMLSAPLALVGAFGAMWASGLPMSLFAQIGLVALVGLVMKNGILLVDYARAGAERGLAPREAMLEAAAVRLRPVLMTAAATIAGMVPVVFGRSDGAEWRQPMAVLIVGGLTSSTLLTLVVVPVFYTLLEGMRLEVARRLRAVRARWAA